MRACVRVDDPRAHSRQSCHVPNVNVSVCVYVCAFTVYSAISGVL